MSTLTEDGIAHVKQVACDRLLSSRVEVKLKVCCAVLCCAVGSCSAGDTCSAGDFPCWGACGSTAGAACTRLLSRRAGQAECAASTQCQGREAAGRRPPCLAAILRHPTASPITCAPNRLAGQTCERCGEPHPRGTGAYLPLRVVRLCGSDWLQCRCAARAVSIGLLGIGLPCCAPAPVSGWSIRGPRVHAAAAAGSSHSCPDAAAHSPRPARPAAAQPKPRDGVSRPPVIPPGVAEARARRDAGDKRKTEKDLQVCVCIPVVCLMLAG